MAWKQMQWKLVAGVATTVVVVGLTGPAWALLRDMRGHWSEAAVATLEAKGLISGTPQQTFDPESPFTRAQMAKLLVLGLGHQADAQALARQQSRFTDVPAWHWATGFVEAVAELGVTTGYPNGEFGPDDQLTRAQFAVLLVRAAGLEDRAQGLSSQTTSYTDDTAIPDWARGAVNAASQAGILTGLPTGAFAPDDVVSRAQGAAAMLRFMQSQGVAYHLVGTLLAYDPVERTGQLRDGVGTVHDFKMDLNAQFFRHGQTTTGFGPQPLDQVWLVLNEDGQGLFLGADYQDVLVKNVRFQGRTLTASVPDGSNGSWLVPTGAQLFMNGRLTQLEELTTAEEAYLVMDQDAFTVRIADLVTAPNRATLAGYDPEKRLLLVHNGDQQAIYQVAADTVVIARWEKATPEDLQPGDQVRFALNPDGKTITYIQSER